MTRKDVRRIAARLNNPILLLALERHEYHGVGWEQVINEAIIELAKQNDYFLDRLNTGRSSVVPPPNSVRRMSPNV